MTKEKTKSRKTILVHASKDSSRVMYPKNSTHKYFSDIFYSSFTNVTSKPICKPLLAQWSLWQLECRKRKLRNDGQERGGTKYEQVPATFSQSDSQEIGPNQEEENPWAQDISRGQ